MKLSSLMDLLHQLQKHL